MRTVFPVADDYDTVVRRLAALRDSPVLPIDAAELLLAASDCLTRHRTGIAYPPLPPHTWPRPTTWLDSATIWLDHADISINGELTWQTA